MKRKNLGEKHVCAQCGCKFYDLGKSRPLCPKCGTEPTEETKKAATGVGRQTGAGDSIYSSSKARQKKVHDEGWETEEPTFDEGDDSDTLGDGLSLVDEGDLSSEDEE